MKTDYTIYVNDKTGNTVVVVPIEKNPLDSRRALIIATRHFKSKTDKLTVVAGIRKGDKVCSVDSLSQKPDCWMVWR